MRKNESGNPKALNVYVVGYSETPLGIHTAKYWKNSSEVQLGDNSTNTFGDPRNTFAQAIAVSENVIYAAGYENEGGVSFAKYWKDGEAVTLKKTSISLDAKATAIAIAGKDIFVAGFERNDMGITIARYWKNGNPANLTDGTFDAVAFSIAVSGNDVYVAGYEGTANGNTVAKYWKNGIAISLTDGSSKYTAAHSIFISGNDVYVAGYEHNGIYHVAKYWKN